MTDRRAEAGKLIRDAERLVVLTGAGVSAESGVPTFRDATTGLWRSHRPEDLATPEAFRRDPELVWSWYQWRRRLVGRCEPNAGHLALARFALAHGHVDLVTQNVDGLHHRAALAAALETSPPKDPEPAFPTELHGALMRDRCSGCGRRSDASVLDGAEPGSDEAVAAQPNPDNRVPVVRCPECEALLRPDVVWFGEALDASALEDAFTAASVADVCLVVGTSSLVYPAAGIPRAALAADRPVIEVNLEATPLTPHATYTFNGPSGRILPELLAT
jgi:NAD-dependent deacetylase